MGELRRDSWTPEMDARLLHLRNVEGWKWAAISADIGRSRTACHAHYIKITEPDDRVYLYRRTWSVADDDRLYRLKFDEKRTVREIALIMKRSVPSIDAKLERMRNGSRRKTHFEPAQRLTVPQRCLDDRDRRYATSHQDLTGAFFGDPLPGFSALDCRGATIALVHG